jgi:pimeloyl-ACP methyl ester carboxylesterase
MTARADAGSIPTAHGRVGRLTWPGRPDGSALLLLHSLGQAADAWSAVAGALAPEHTVYALDLPGHGASDAPADATAAAAADLLAPAVRGVAGETPGPLHIAAHAYAAPLLAVALERLGPLPVASLTFVCPLGVVPPATDPVPALPWPKAMAARALARRPERVRDALAFLCARPERVPDAAWQALSASLARAEALWRFGPDLLRDVPALLTALARLGRGARFVWCDRDPVFAAAPAAAAVAAAPGPRHSQVRLDDAGHLPMLEAPARLAAVLRPDGG